MRSTRNIIRLRLITLLTAITKHVYTFAMTNYMFTRFLNIFRSIVVHLWKVYGNLHIRTDLDSLVNVTILMHRLSPVKQPVLSS